MDPMPAPEIRAAMAKLDAWHRRGSRIHREYTFGDFPLAIAFVNAVAAAAESARHHPDIDIRWNRVRLALTTHDAGGLTELDFVLAARCDALAKPGSSVSRRAPGPRPAGKTPGRGARRRPK